MHCYNLEYLILFPIISTATSCWSWVTSRKGRRRLYRNVHSVTQWKTGAATKWDPTCGVYLGGRQDRLPATATHRPTSIKVWITVVIMSVIIVWLTPWLTCLVHTLKNWHWCNLILNFLCNLHLLSFGWYDRQVLLLLLKTDKRNQSCPTDRLPSAISVKNMCIITPNGVSCHLCKPLQPALPSVFIAKFLIQWIGLHVSTRTCSSMAQFLVCMVCSVKSKQLLNSWNQVRILTDSFTGPAAANKLLWVSALYEKPF